MVDANAVPLSVPRCRGCARPGGCCCCSWLSWPTRWTQPPPTAQRRPSAAGSWWTRCSSSAGTGASTSVSAGQPPAAGRVLPPTPHLASAELGWEGKERFPNLELFMISLYVAVGQEKSKKMDMVRVTCINLALVLGTVWYHGESGSCTWFSGKLNVAGEPYVAGSPVIRASHYNNEDVCSQCSAELGSWFILKLCCLSVAS